MKKFWYVITAVILIGALSLSLAACNKKEDSPKEDEIDKTIAAEGIALNWQEVLMVKGTAVTLTHTVSPDGATGTATYTSSDTAVVQVTDAGMVSAVGTGVATVTAKIDDAHYAECRVIVGDIIVSKGDEQDSGATTSEPGDTTGDGTGTGDGNTTEGGNDTGNGTGMGGGASGDTTPPTEGGNNAEDGTGDGNTMGGGTDIGNGDTTGNTESGNGTGTGDTTDDTAGAGEATGVSGNTTQTPASGGNNATDTEGAANAEGQAETRRTISGGVKGTTLFDKVQDAVTAATAEKVIVIDSGVYREDVTIDKNLTLLGVNNPKTKAVTVGTGAKVKLQNVSVILDEYPSAGEAAIHVLTGGEIEVVNCVVSTATEGELEGGYGILVDKQSRGVRVTDNSIGNFRYGVYVCPTDQSVRIERNKLSNMAVGIGLDVRQENAETNYPTLGSIRQNEYNEVEKHTQFLHYGANYEGDFDFEDNETENESNGEGSAGGSGLLE